MGRKFSVKIKQHDYSDCGVACIASIAAYWGLKLPLAKIRLFSYTNQEGTTIRGIIDAASKFGLKATGFKANSDSLYKIPTPAILHIKKPTGMLHFIVLYKVIENNFLIMDPAYGSINKISIEELTNHWSGYLILFEKTPSFECGDYTTNHLKIIRELIKPYRGFLIISLVLSILYILISMCTSIFIQQIIDVVIPSKNTVFLTNIGISIAILTILSITISLFKSKLLLRVGICLDKHLIYEYISRTLKLPQSFFDLRRCGEITSRVEDAFKISSLITEASMSLIICILSLFTAIIFMFTIYWKLAIIATLFIPCYIALYYFFDKLNRRTMWKLMEEGAKFESFIIDAVKSIKTVKHFSLEQDILTITNNSLVSLNRLVVKNSYNGIAASSFGDGISRVMSLAILWSGSLWVLDAKLSTGELLSFFTLLTIFSSPLSQLISNTSCIREGLVAADRIFENFDSEANSSTPELDLELTNFSKISLINISFNYSNRHPIFNDLSLDINQGEILGIRGKSGSGKSTLASLLLRMNNISQGIITVDGTDIQKINLKKWRTFITIVPQNLDLLSGTLLENITLWDKDPNIEQVVRIMRELDLSKLLNNAPMGLESHLGESSNLLSRGQQQRIAFARAVYRNPKVLILDEASSSLDSYSEKLILESILKLRENGTTIILITHNEANFNIADRVIDI